MNLWPEQHDVPVAIMHKDYRRRLDAIIRRLGGTVKPDHTGTTTMYLPPVGKRDCPDQLTLWD